MKKFLVIALSAVLALSLVACGGGKKDGVYTAKVDDATAEAAYGWADQLSVTYKDGKIVDAKFTSLNAEGKEKQNDPTYQMDPAPSVWMPELAANVVAAGTSDKVAAVAGASHSSANAKALLAAIEKDGKPGETITVTVPATAE